MSNISNVIYMELLTTLNIRFLKVVFELFILLHNMLHCFVPRSFSDEFPLVIWGFSVPFSQNMLYWPYGMIRPLEYCPKNLDHKGVPHWWVICRLISAVWFDYQKLSKCMTTEPLGMLLCDRFRPVRTQRIWNSALNFTRRSKHLK